MLLISPRIFGSALRSEPEVLRPQPALRLPLRADRAALHAKIEVGEQHRHLRIQEAGAVDLVEVAALQRRAVHVEALAPVHLPDVAGVARRALQPVPDLVDGRLHPRVVELLLVEDEPTQISLHGRLVVASVQLTKSQIHQPVVRHGRPKKIAQPRSDLVMIQPARLFFEIKKIGRTQDGCVTNLHRFDGQGVFRAVVVRIWRLCGADG